MTPVCPARYLFRIPCPHDPDATVVRALGQSFSLNDLVSPVARVGADLRWSFGESTDVAWWIVKKGDTP